MTFRPLVVAGLFMLGIAAATPSPGQPSGSGGSGAASSSQAKDDLATLDRMCDEHVTAGQELIDSGKDALEKLKSLAEAAGGAPKPETKGPAPPASKPVAAKPAEPPAVLAQ